jgi:hypothetical protein
VEHLIAILKSLLNFILSKFSGGILHDWKIDSYQTKGGATMETAMLLIAAFSGILTGIQTWLQYKDRSRTLEAQENAYREALESPKTRIIAERIISIVPTDIIDLLKKRVEDCYNKFKRMLINDDEYFEEDLNGAAKNALPACVCRNLNMIIDVAVNLPDEELDEAWEKYKCKERQEKSMNYV